MKTSDLRAGERLIVDRRRRAESQQAAAERLGVTLYRYRLWEEGQLVPTCRRPALGALRPHESCYLLRRRAGLKLRDIADALGTSRWWVTQMESGRAPIDRLLAYWSPSRCRAAG